MEKNKKDDNLTVNIISPPDDIRPVSKSSVGNAKTAPFCVYAGKRHAVGSIIKHDDGSESICTEDGDWQNR